MHDRVSGKVAESVGGSHGHRVVRILLPIVLLILGWILYSVLSVEQAEEKRPPPKPRVVKTAVTPLQLTDYQTIVRTQGVVRPHHEVTLTAEVSGKSGIFLALFGGETGYR